MKRLIISSLLLAANISNAATLTVIINNLQNKNGQVLIGLFNQESSFPHKGQEYKGNVVYPITSSSAVTIFNNIPQGIYAIAVIHDENLSGSLSKNIFGIPTEQYGFSNNIYSKFGPPTFESVKFGIKNDLQVTINLK